MTGTILQVSISAGGVPKLPIPRAQVGVEGLAGDSFRHPEFHGGPQQAVLLISSEILERLKQEGFPVFPGALGENLTTQGLDYRELRFGQRFQAGSIELELTKLRQPCKTLNRYNPGGVSIQSRLYDLQARASNPESPVWGFGGFYAKVIRSGEVAPGDTILLVSPVS